MATKEKYLFARRRRRNRHAIRKRANGKPRLSVFRSGKHIYAQVIDDLTGETRASASTVEKDLRNTIRNGANMAAAEACRQLVRGALKSRRRTGVFDRGGSSITPVKALAEAAREAGPSSKTVATTEWLERTGRRRRRGGGGDDAEIRRV